MICHVTIHDKKLTNHDMPFFQVKIKKKTKSLFVTFVVARNTPDPGITRLTHAAPNGIEGQCRGMPDSISNDGCEQRAAAQRHCLARANEHVAATRPRGRRETARRESENILRISRAMPGRRYVRLESHTPGRASARGLNIPRAGPGAVYPALWTRVGPTRKDLGLKI